MVLPLETGTVRYHGPRPDVTAPRSERSDEVN
jgi:hypothetical protein